MSVEVLEKQVKQKPIKTEIDYFREKALLMLDDNQKLLLFLGNDSDIQIEIPYKEDGSNQSPEGFINKFHRKRICNIFKLSGQEDFKNWLKLNVLKYAK